MIGNGKLRNRLSIAASYFRHKTVLTGGPVEITLESTAKCNLYCPMCPRHIFTFDNENMDLELFRKVIQDCKDYVEFVSAALRLPIDLVGVGAARERVLA